MSDVLDFPEQEKYYQRQAQLAIQNHQFSKAYQLLVRSYQIAPNLDTFKQIMTLLNMTQQNDQIKEWWEQIIPFHNFDNMPTNSEMIELYIESLPLMFDSQTALLKAFQLQTVLENKQFNTQQLQAFIQKHSHYQQVEQTIQNSTSTSQLMPVIEQMYQQSLYNLLNIIDYFVTFPLEKSQLFYQAILLHSTIPNFIKGQVAQHLLHLGFKETVLYLWFDQQCTVDFALLSPLFANQSFQQGNEAIEQYSQKQDPHLTPYLHSQYYLYCLSLYPFITENILPINEWLEAVLPGKIISEQDPLSQLSEQEKFFRLATEEAKQLS